MAQLPAQVDDGTAKFVVGQIHSDQVVGIFHPATLVQGGEQGG